MEHNISHFSLIEIKRQASNASKLEALYALPGIYGMEECEFSVKFYFLGEDSKECQSFIKKTKELDLAIENTRVPPKNWNEVWESAFQPVAVGNKWYIRAPFHQSKEGFDHEIIIAPKMAFGTGHHATTFMMLEVMADMVLKEKKVLDLGCGSGILSIAAEKKGAASILAVDYDPLSVENTIENLKINNGTKIAVSQIDVESFDKKGFDLVLANINKNVLMENLYKIEHLVNPGGSLIISGVMTADAEEINKKISRFTNSIIFQKSNWICIHFY